jgi:hypothetical protein
LISEVRREKRPDPLRVRIAGMGIQVLVLRAFDCPELLGPSGALEQLASLAYRRVGVTRAG